MEIWQPEPGQESRGQLIRLRNKYSFAQTNWKNAFENGWTLFAGAALSSNFDDIHIDSIRLERKNQLAHGKFTATKDFSDKLSMNTGLEYFNH